MERMLEQCSPLSSYFLSCECGDFSDPGGRSGAICGCMIAATRCVRICRRSYDGALPACPVTPRPNCRMTIFARGDCIASSALRPRRVHSSRNKRSAKAPKYFARRRRSSCLMTSVNDPNPPLPPASPSGQAKFSCGCGTPRSVRQAGDRQI